jgi:hypothetical protein
MNSLPVHEGASPIMTQSLPVTLARNISHAPHDAPLSPQQPQQRYMQMMQQRYNPNPCTNDPLSEYDQPPFPGYQLPDCQQMTVGRARQDPRGTRDGFPENSFRAAIWVLASPQALQTEEIMSMEHREVDHSGLPMETTTAVNCYNVIPNVTDLPREQTTLPPTTY